MKTNQKIEIIQKFTKWLNDTVVFEEEQPQDPTVDEIKDAKVPTEAYTIELDGEETILNIYEDGTTEPALADGKYVFKEDENKLIVIEDGLFKGLEDKEIPEPSADPIEENLPVVQEDDEKKEDEEPTEEPKEEETDDETGNDDDTKKALDEALAKIAELEAKIAELEAALVGKDKEIETLKKQPTTQKVDTPKVDVKPEKDNFGKLFQALNKKMA